MTESAPLSPLETLPALLAWRAALTPTKPAQWNLGEGGQWRSGDWRAYFSVTAQVAASLRRLGLTPGDRLGIMAPTGAQWDVVQLAALAAGGVVVGIDVHEHDERLAKIFELCEISGLVVADEALLARLPQAAKARLDLVITLAPQACVKGACGWDDLTKTTDTDATWIDEARPEAFALIVFTSGTTEAPKGIAYTHRQVTLAYTAILDAFPDIGAGARLACWLPLSNLFQRMINFCAIARGAQTYYVENPRDLMHHLPRIAPHVFIAVPRFYEKFYAGILERLQTKPHWQKRLFETALDLARRVAILRDRRQRVSIMLRLASVTLNSAVLRAARAAMGGQLSFLVSGSAPMPQWLLRDLAALGMPVYEAYGLSENIVPISVNRPGAIKYGSVGKLLRPNEICIAEDGELLVRGPGVFTGYFGEPPAPRNADGFLATGDYAEQDKDGFITLTGRKSEIFKTSTGRRIAPNGIEAFVKQVPYVEQCLVLGASRPFVVAIIWLTVSHLEQARPGIMAAVRRAVAGLPDYQQPSGLILSTQMLYIERGEITSNLKLRRKQIELNYTADIERLYAQILNQQGNTVVAQA